MKPSALKESIRTCLHARLVPLVEGDPGLGKTAVHEELAREEFDEFLPLVLSVMEPVDLMGLPTVENGCAHFAPLDPVARLFNTDRRILCLFDDFGQAAHAVQSAVMQIIHGGRINGHTVGPNVRFSLASNRPKDKAGVNRILTPIRGRSITLSAEADVEDWTKWALSAGIRVEIIAFLRWRPALLHVFDPSIPDKAFPSPRAWEFASRILAARPDPSAEYELYTGTIGEGAAAELTGFLRIYRSLPSPDAILLSPDTAPVPDDPATLYALSGALSRKASDQTIERLVTYANRMPPEFSVLLVRDAIARDATLTSSRAFIQWASSHADVLI